MEDHVTVWKQASEILQKNVVPVSYDTWIKPLIPVYINNDEIALESVSDYILGMIQLRCPRLQGANLKFA